MEKRKIFVMKRIISTYVENTYMEMLYKVTVRDHLHLRGEYYSASPCLVSVVGSSPLTWRILFSISLLSFSSRIISTYVENTIPIPEMKLKVKDHLHLRGEYLDSSTTWWQNSGSSPLTWRIQNI